MKIKLLLVIVLLSVMAAFAQVTQPPKEKEPTVTVLTTHPEFGDVFVIEESIKRTGQVVTFDSGFINDSEIRIDEFSANCQTGNVLVLVIQGKDLKTGVISKDIPKEPLKLTAKKGTLMETVLNYVCQDKRKSDKIGI